MQLSDMENGMSDFVKKIERLDAVYRQLPNHAATIAVTFSKDRFREQAWVDNRTEPWRKRKVEGRRGRGRAILVSSGRLKRSVRKIRVGPTIAVIGTDVPYASLHNYGGTIRKTVKVKQHSRGRGSNKSSVKAHQRKMNVTMPRRQFIGESRVLANRIERGIASEILKALQ